MVQAVFFFIHTGIQMQSPGQEGHCFIRRVRFWMTTGDRERSRYING